MFEDTSMVDLPSDPDPGDDASTPRWVKVVGIVVLVLILLVVVVMLAGGGPGGHAPPAGGH
jgi:hypothetical protein